MKLLRINSEGEVGYFLYYGYWFMNVVKIFLFFDLILKSLVVLSVVFRYMGFLVYK